AHRRRHVLSGGGPGSRPVAVVRAARSVASTPARRARGLTTGADPGIRVGGTRDLGGPRAVVFHAARSDTHGSSDRLQRVLDRSPPTTGDRGRGPSERARAAGEEGWGLSCVLAQGQLLPRRNGG